VTRCPPGFNPRQRLRGAQDLRCLIGWLGEETAIEAFQSLGVAAQRWPAGAFHISTIRAAGETQPGYDIFPDLWLPDEAAVVEVKSSMLGRRFYAPTRQARAYKAIHEEAAVVGPQWPISQPRMIYAFVAFRYARPDRPTVEEAVMALQPEAIILADHDIVASWMKEVGDYGRDWASKHTGLVVYENFHRLTVRRVRDLAAEALKTAFAAQKEGRILRLESEIGRRRARSGETLAGITEKLALEGRFEPLDADYSDDWPPDVGF